jgi:acetoacetate decarboxylase
MSYPSAPWDLQGYAIQTLQLLDVDRVRPLVPSELEIVSLLPGKTLGGVYVASYGEGSVLQYNELIVVSAVVHHAGKWGGWISHIYVDHPDSIAGGREIWGLPKEFAQFSWKTGNTPSVQVSQEDNLLCTLNSKWQLPGWQQPLAGLVFSTLDSALLTFRGHGKLNWHLTSADLHIPARSPFAWLGVGQPWLSVYCNPLHLTVDAPSVIQTRVGAAGV